MASALGEEGCGTGTSGLWFLSHEWVPVPGGPACCRLVGTALPGCRGPAPRTRYQGRGARCQSHSLRLGGWWRGTSPSPLDRDLVSSPDPSTEGSRAGGCGTAPSSWLDEADTVAASVLRTYHVLGSACNLEKQRLLCPLYR